jgi:hypothetical protein
VRGRESDLRKVKIKVNFIFRSGVLMGDACALGLVSMYL